MQKANIQTIAIAVFIAIIASVGGYVLYKKNNPTGDRTYTNNEYGVSFSYPADYELTESKLQEGAAGTVVTITEDKVEIPVNGEGPTAITIQMFDDAPFPSNGNTPAETWVLTSPYSNFKLSNMESPSLTTVMNKNAYLYTWDGLYQGTSVVMEHNGNILMFSVTYDGETDLAKREVFTDILANLQLTENQTATSTPVTSGNTIPKQETLTGVYECLPHKTQGQAQTAECMFGIKTGDGNHYALDMTAISNTLKNTQMNAAIRATGILVPIEQISTDRWQVYDIKGIMSVQTFEKL